MKFLLRLSLATLLVTSTFAANANAPPSPFAAPAPAKGPTGNALQDFINDPQIQAIAPHLILQFSPSSPPTYSFAPSSYNADSSPFSSSPIADTKIPLLNDIIEIISMSIFNSKHADWSRLEAAKLRAIQRHGEEAVDIWGDLNAMDVHRAAVIVRTIYDTVVHIPATNKETYAARLDPKTNTKSGGSFWDFLGFGLVKSSEALKGVKSLVSPPSFTCETSDEAYLRGVDETVYYSSLTDGLAGGTLAAAPPDSAAATPHDQMAQMARDLFNIKRLNLLSRVPMSSLKSLEDSGALALLTQGAGHPSGGGSGGPRLFSGIPVLRNLFAFSSDVLSSNALGEVVKFVFCPEADALPAVVPPSSGGVLKGEQHEQEKKPAGHEHDQKVLKVSKRSLRRDEAIKNAMELAKQRAAKVEDIKDKEL
ncbi:hypothetical protein BGZ97_011690 [Linnemannia gamsii]|uniref:Uncharacterized protein n=1 Tax=Linnemannia gamsii TaxID=64522 RepID=A0A9P6UMQ9_9FUNG|nr:hypothetical protein BGZ97_011690 [Linnemannia gamsii]